MKCIIKMSKKLKILEQWVLFVVIFEGCNGNRWTLD